MNRTYPPEIAPDVLQRLDAYAARFRDAFDRPRPAAWCGVYLRGLLTDADRKSIEPMSRKVTPPPGLAVKDLDQALQQFVGQSPWDENVVWRRYRSVMAETFASPQVLWPMNCCSAWSRSLTANPSGRATRRERGSMLLRSPSRSRPWR